MIHERDISPQPGEEPVDDYQRGYMHGRNDGWIGRDFSPPEHMSGNDAFVRGYRDGYRCGQEDPKPRGQLPPAEEEK